MERKTSIQSKNSNPENLQRCLKGAKYGRVKFDCRCLQMFVWRNGNPAITYARIVTAKAMTHNYITHNLLIVPFFTFQTM